MSIEQLKTAMVKFEASRVACEQHAGYVQAELQVSAPRVEGAARVQ